MKALIYGPSGQGKTYFVGTMNDDERTFPGLVLDYEGGVSSLIGRDIDVVTIRDWQDYEEARVFLAKGAHKYRSVAIDSISEAHVNALLSRLDERNNRREPDQLDQNDYGIALVKMRRLLRMFRDLPMHVFCTALAKEETDVREGLVKKPALSGALADEVVGIFESVSYLALTEVNEEIDGKNVPVTHRVLILNNQPKIRAKTRVPVGIQPPAFLMDPTVSTLLSVLGF